MDNLVDAGFVKRYDHQSNWNTVRAKANTCEGVDAQLLYIVDVFRTPNRPSYNLPTMHRRS